MITAKIQNREFCINVRLPNAQYLFKGPRSHVNRELSQRVIPQMKKVTH